MIYITYIRNSITALTTDNKVFIWTLLFLGSLYFIPNNKFFLLSTVIFSTGLYMIWRQILPAILYSYVLLIPFSVGKGIDFLLIPNFYINPGRVGIASNPFVMTFNISLANVYSVFLMYIYLRRRFLANEAISKARLDISDIFMLFFISINILVSLFSNIPLLSMLLTLQLCSYIFIYYFIQNLNLKIWLIKILPILISAFCIFEGLWCGMQFINHRPLFKYIENISEANASSAIHTASENATFFRTQGTFNHPNDLGLFMASILPFLLFLSLFKKSNNFSKIIASVGLLTGLMAFILSGSRASWIIFVVAVFLLFQVKNIRKKLKILPIMNRVFRIFIYMSLITVPLYIFPRLIQFNKTFNQEGGVSFRTDLLKKSIDVSLLHPFGIGLGLFPQVLFEEIGGFTSAPTEPHNILAQVLVASGYPGVISFIGFFYLKLRQTFFIHSSKKIELDIHRVGLLSTGVYLALSMFYPILTEQIFALVWILLAIAV